MGSDVAEVVEKLPHPSVFKVSFLMCTVLKKLVDRISRVFLLIEAARPPSSSGIEALGSLNLAIETAKRFLKSCKRSSKLYLAVRGDVIASECQRSKNLFVRSLGQLQEMVPLELAEEITHIMDDLGRAKFMLEFSEEEASKAVRRFLLKGTTPWDSMETLDVKTLQLVASTCHITSPNDIRTEKKLMEKMLDKVDYSDPMDKETLKSLLHLLKHDANLILMEQSGNPCVQHEEAFAFENSRSGSLCSQSFEVESGTGCRHHEAQIDVSSRAIPPEEFICPISSRLMYDPVVIASGQTFERMYIQKWFDEGNDTCPKTKMKLDHQSLTPNTAMKDLISKWCMRNGITISDPTMLPEVLYSWGTTSTSISSFGSSVNDLCLPVDLSNVTIGSLYSSYTLKSSHPKIGDGINLISMPTNEEPKCQSYANIQDTDLEFLSKLAELQWESQCEVIEVVKKHLNHKKEACHSMSSVNIVEPFDGFLREALDRGDVKALKAGSQLLLAFVSKIRSGISYSCAEAFRLLATLLNSEMTKEALDILEHLSVHPYCRGNIAESGALTSILELLDSHNRDFQERAIKILCNLSSDCDICSHILPSECIPKLVPFFVDSTLAGYCVLVLKNLCGTEEARVSVAETNGCIASVAELLASASLEDQENAVAVLLSLCSQSVQYCQLVMDIEGVIPSLFDISVNCNDKGRASALELLRCLRDVKRDNGHKCSGSDTEVSRDSKNLSNERKSSKASRFLGRISNVFETRFSGHKKEETRLVSSAKF